MQDDEVRLDFLLSRWRWVCYEKTTSQISWWSSLWSQMPPIGWVPDDSQGAMVPSELLMQYWIRAMHLRTTKRSAPLTVSLTNVVCSQWLMIMGLMGNCWMVFSHFVATIILAKLYRVHLRKFIFRLSGCWDPVIECRVVLAVSAVPINTIPNLRWYFQMTTTKKDTNGIMLALVNCKV